MIVQVNEPGHHDPVGTVEDLGPLGIQPAPHGDDLLLIEEDITALKHAERTGAQPGIHGQDERGVADEYQPVTTCLAERHARRPDAGIADTEGKGESKDAPCLPAVTGYSVPPCTSFLPAFHNRTSAVPVHSMR